MNSIMNSALSLLLATACVSLNCPAQSIQDSDTNTALAATVWSTTSSIIERAPNGNFVLITANNKTFSALDRANGQPLWSQPRNPEFLNPFFAVIRNCLSNSGVLVTGEDGNLLVGRSTVTG